MNEVVTANNSPESTTRTTITGRPAPSVHERDARICEMRAEGHTLESIAGEFGITRERVRQIVLREGGATASDVRRTRADERDRRFERMARAVVRWVTAHPGCTAAEVCDALGVTPEDVRWALGPRAGAVLVRGERDYERVTDEELLEGIRRAAALVEGPLTFTRYCEIAPRIGALGGVRVEQRLGGWAHACRLAGVQPGRTPRPHYSRRWTHDDLLTWVALYLDEPFSRGSFEEYSRWAQRTPGAPSGQTVRNRFGTWAVAKRAALSLLHPAPTPLAAAS